MWGRLILEDRHRTAVNMYRGSSKKRESILVYKLTIGRGSSVFLHVSPAKLATRPCELEPPWLWTHLSMYSLVENLLIHLCSPCLQTNSGLGAEVLMVQVCAARGRGREKGSLLEILMHTPQRMVEGLAWGSAKRGPRVGPRWALRARVSMSRSSLRLDICMRQVKPWKLRKP